MALIEVPNSADLYIGPGRDIDGGRVLVLVDAHGHADCVIASGISHGEFGQHTMGNDVDEEAGEA